jgi:hypothetical protein
LNSGGNNNVIIGHGVGFFQLVNNDANSMMIGFNSDVPTVYIGASSRVGTFGNVGIGNVTAPSEVLDVRGTARLRVVPQNSDDVLITGAEQSAAGDYQLNYLAFSSDASQYLGGDAQWYDVPAATGQNADNGISLDSDNMVLGNDVGDTDAELNSDREIPLNDQNIYFTDPSTIDGAENNIGIGRSTSQPCNRNSSSRTNGR